MTVAAVLTASDAQTGRENEIERTRLAMMRHYAEHDGCRRSFLLSYFGQDYPGPAETATTTARTRRLRRPRRLGCRSRWAPGW